MGAEPELADSFGCTPLAVCAINGHTRVVDELLKSLKPVHYIEIEIT